MESPLIVQAEYPFKGGNNDELCFKKGDLITVTQREEGGWWEGTLNDKTGWFPSNYVIEYKVPLTKTDTMRPPEEIQEYRSVVLKDLLDSERAHVAEIEGLLENFLQPLLETEILTQDEYVQLMCNFVDVVNTHNELLSQMEECNDRIGKLFLTKAPLMKHVHQAYCAAHPKAIVVLDKHKDELEKYMERQGAATPGLLVLTTGLSKPFRRLDKYSAMLQELERHMESSHPDRGDTQRSVAVYKDIAATCSATRRQKELELQVLTGPVRGWQGQELSSLGDIIHMGSVAVGFDHRDRYFVLFPQTLLILSVSQRMSAFIYEGKLPLTGIVVNRLEDSDTFKNAFEISGNFIEKIVAVCQGPNEANKWVELLTSANPTIPIGIKRQLSNLSNSSVSGAAPQPPPHISHFLDTRGYCTRFSLCAYYTTPLSNSFRVTLPPSNYPPAAPYANLSAHFAKLVKDGKLYDGIVKMLLYPQIRQSIDLKSILMRKKRSHKTTLTLAKEKCKNAKAYKADDSNISNKSELERQDAFELPTDSESDSEDISFGSKECGDCISNPFEYVKFYTNKRNSLYDSSQTFIDYGSAANTLQHGRHCSSINLINFDSSGERQSYKPSSEDADKKSIIIASNAVRILSRKSSGQNSIIHTSTAHFNLKSNAALNFGKKNFEGVCARAGDFQYQNSDLSQPSSDYNERLGGAYFACENLTELSDETRIHIGCDKIPEVREDRHSMPNIFVKNSFQGDFPLYRSQDQINKRYTATSDEIHSSSIDIPAACRYAPDNLQTELLYNSGGAPNEEKNLNLFAAPFTSNKSIKNSTTNNMPYEICFDDASLERMYGEQKISNSLRNSSTVELCIDPKDTLHSSTLNARPNSLRRCISYQFVDISNNEDNESKEGVNMKTPSNNNKEAETFRKLNEKHSCVCKCCESSQCPSPRSSDSGMAGSCTITSPDPPNTIKPYNDYDFTDDVSYMLPSFSNCMDSKHFEVCGTFRKKFFPLRTQSLVDPEVQPFIGTDTQRANAYPTNPNISPFHLNLKKLPINTIEPKISSLECPTTSADDISNMFSLPLTSRSEDNIITTQTFRSDLYAHWWKNEKLPMEVERGIVYTHPRHVTMQNSQGSKDEKCSACTNSLYSIEARGYSEGNTYCSICQDCASLSSIAYPTTNTTNTTTTTLSSNNSLCEHNHSNDNIMNPARKLVTNRSNECPICLRVLAQVESLDSGDIAVVDSKVFNVNTVAVGEDIASNEHNSSKSTDKSIDTTDNNDLSCNVTSVTTQTESIVQSPLKLQSIHAHSASTTSSSSATTTKSTKSSSASKPQIKFSPDIEQFFENSKPKHGGNNSSSNNNNSKRKDRKHKS
ncbi:uncharacterized protein LOC119687177 isoform X1 [Teleopsis dalmanni]|uniref:uncharacterized protein LOC119687177 isoform X1 n=1 Tax=Teleopsis dalmanni TaxID=139649 RepID=UPI0018CE2327|nr:uncharacterized protein LOC119687177 isoform X1 [Teleopsis dalmanni]XP_037957336.1 uncharacterized protein LOC119687177 isoform X1 [Teleopsis dalmanni]XP_037957337.1 uncharacterized protein LOC119687177 isoform X1 [Teleopsis dalmanni]